MRAARSTSVAGAEVLHSSAAWDHAARVAGRPLVLAALHPHYRPAEVALAALAVAERRRAQLVVGLAHPADPVTAWMFTTSMHGLAVHLREEAGQRLEEDMHWDTLGLLSLSDVPWVIVSLPGLGSVRSLHTVAQRVAPDALVLARGPRFVPCAWPARAARALRSHSVDLVLCGTGRRLGPLPERDPAEV